MAKVNILQELESIEAAESGLDQRKRALLRATGWTCSSDHPGCLWLWSKTIRNRTYHLDQQTALWMEQAEAAFAEAIGDKSDGTL